MAPAVSAAPDRAAVTGAPEAPAVTAGEPASLDTEAAEAEPARQKEQA
jgi:hypothetical protein